eukprot:540220-Rhodomonas_salina.2
MLLPGYRASAYGTAQLLSQVRTSSLREGPVLSWSMVVGSQRMVDGCYMAVFGTALAYGGVVVCGVRY